MAGTLHPNAGASKHLNRRTNDSEMIYGDGIHGSMSEETIREALDRKVIIEESRKMVVSQFGGTANLPLHSGKVISKEVILPIMSDKNINDQGIDANGVTIVNGNLIGSSLDFNALGSVARITEHGGDGNRVGFTKTKVQGSISEFGFYIQHSEDAFMFSNTLKLEAHIKREMLRAASELYELHLASDLINGAGVIKYGGLASSLGEVTGNRGDVPSIITYEGLLKLTMALDDTRTPKDTQIIKGSRNIDTKTINAARYAIVGSELFPTFLRMKNVHGEKAYVSVEKYASAGNIAEGEIGSVDGIRIIKNEFSGVFRGSGATVTTNDGYRATNGKYDVSPLIIIGKGSFSTIGLRGANSGTDIKKWKVHYIKPGSESSYALDHYGKTGSMSISWWYGTLIERPERLAVYYAVAEL